MIEVALTFIKDELNTYISNKLNSPSSETVFLTKLVEQDGSTVNLQDESVNITLINIEEERANKSQTPVRKNVNGVIQQYSPEQRFNLYILFSVYARANYEMSLTLISYVISFFQGKNVFTSGDNPGLSGEIEKLIFELQPTNWEQLNHIWAAQGAKYMPSVIYKARLLTVFDERPQGTEGYISTIQTNLKKN